MTAKPNKGAAEGCGTLIGIALAAVTFAWPLFALHRHWTTYRLVNCATYPEPFLLDGCVYDSRTGQYTGTATASTHHSAISATGWIVEAAWLTLVVSLILLALASDKRKRRGKAAKTLTVPFGRLAGAQDVADPAIPKDNLVSEVSPDDIVRFHALDESSKELLARVQQAITSILTSNVYADDQLEHAVAESTLRRHEWAIATDLREITNLRKDQAAASRGASNPGPLTAAVITAQQKAMQQKIAKVKELAESLETYAAHIKAADLALADWEAAAELAKLNPRFSDLVAGTAADDHNLQEVQNMAEEASAYQASLTKANLAARTLFLPDA